MDFRTVLLFQADALAAVFLAAVGSARYRVGASADAILIFQEIYLLLRAVFLSEIGVDAPLAACDIAAAGQGLFDLILGDEPLHGGNFRHFGAIFSARQGQLPQALLDIL